MNRTVEEKLKASILEVLENWWDGGAQHVLADATPYVGGDTFAQMANAALAVFLAVADIEESMRSDGILKDD